MIWLLICLVIKKLNPILTELFIKGRKLNIYLVSDIDFQDFLNLYKKRTPKPYPFSVIDATLASDNPLCFRKNLLEKI